jgi:hydroxymethylpyrimidine pyrophosphatase-like HAD family hydrolase
MRYLALATDYDGTLASSGRVDARTAAALERVRASGRRLLLVTGRILADLEAVFPGVRLFDAVVAENGATLWRREEGERALAPAPPPALLELLRARGVPFDVGRVVVATREPHDAAVLRAIRELGLDLEIVFNKGAVMALPAGTTKASGLDVALAELALTHHEVVSIGDAENDLAMLAASECGVAVDNALPAVKAAADLVTRGARGEGVVELADRLLAGDLAGVDPPRHRLALGSSAAGRVTLPPARTRAVVLGPSSAARRAVVAGAALRLAARDYQVCALDPDGAYAGLKGFAPIGTGRRPPEVEEITALLARSGASVAADLSGLAEGDRPAFVADLWAALRGLRARAARPHWLVLDEAHPALARGLFPALASSAEVGAVLLGTPHPGRLPEAVLAGVDTAIATGEDAPAALRAMAAALRAPAPSTPRPADGEALLWRAGEPVVAFRPLPPADAALARTGPA